MINNIENRIKSCEARITLFKNLVPSSDLEKMYNDGMVEGLKSQLKVLNELLISAIELEELSKSA